GRGESIPGFLWRNLQSEFKLFVVGPDTFSGIYRALWYLSGVALVAALYLCHYRPVRRSSPLAGLPLAFSLFILVSMAVTSVSGQYPFGGEIRHQFLVFPFLVLSGVCLLDQIEARMPPAGFRESLGAVALLMALTLCARQLNTFPVWTEKLFEAEITAFRQAI